MQPNQITKDLHRIAWRMYKLRGRSMCLTADLVALRGCLHGIRKRKTRGHANQQEIARAEAAFEIAMANVGG